MDRSYPGQLRLWHGPGGAAVQDLYGPPGAGLVIPDPRTLAEARDPEEAAGRLFACESLKAPPPGKYTYEGEPYTLQWFLSIENHRHGRHARWIPRLLEFARHQGETLLGLGHGLGTDWLQYARNGADVVVCSSCTSQLELIRRNFSVRGLEGRFLHAAPSCLPLEANSIDVACISGLLQDVDPPQRIVEEVFRVLKPGGKVIAVTPAKYDVDYWRKIFFWWERWLGVQSRVPERTERKFTSRRLRRLFGRFEIHRICKRQLRRSELPRLWRLWPLALTERVIGRVLVLKAFKPLSFAMQAVAAAQEHLMDIQQLALELTEQDLNQLAMKHLTGRLPVDNLQFKLTPEGMQVNGEFPLFVPVRFSAWWELGVRDGKVTARLTKLHALGLPVTILRGMILKHVGESASKLDWLAFDNDLLSADLDKFAAREGFNLRTNLQSIRCRDGTLLVTAGVAPQIR